MSLKTRINPLSEDNNQLTIKESDGSIVAVIKILGDKGATLDITTVEGMYIEKPNGWSSKKG